VSPKRGSDLAFRIQRRADVRFGFIVPRLFGLSKLGRCTIHGIRGKNIWFAWWCKRKHDSRRVLRMVAAKDGTANLFLMPRVRYSGMRLHRLGDSGSYGKNLGVKWHWTNRAPGRRLWHLYVVENGSYREGSRPPNHSISGHGASVSIMWRVLSSRGVTAWAWL